MTVERSKYLFDSENEISTDSKLEIWIEEPESGMTTYLPEWENNIDKCSDGTVDGCFTSALCTSASRCSVPISPAIAKNMINNLHKNDAYDEAIMHVWIQIAGDESTGTKDTIITITGKDSTSF